MPAERVSMRQIREVLRLRFASELPQRAIAKSLGLSQGAVSGYLSRARAAGVSWRLAADLDDAQLDSAAVPAATGDRRGSAPDARLGLGASRTAPSQCHLGTAMGGVPRRRTRRVRVFLVLRPLPGLGPTCSSTAAARKRPISTAALSAPRSADGCAWFGRAIHPACRVGHDRQPAPRAFRRAASKVLRIRHFGR